MAATLWGTTGTAATFAPGGSSSVAIGAAAMGIGGLALFLGAALQALRVLRTGAGGRVLWVGAVCVIAYPLAFYTSMSDAGVAIGATLTIGASPVVAALIERMRAGRRLSRRWATAVAIAIAGAILLGGARSPVIDRGVGAQLVGAVLALAAASCYAGYSVAAAEIVAQGGHPRAAVGALFGLASLPLIAILLLTGSTLLASTRGVLVTGYLGLVPMSVGYVLFGHGLKSTGASTATALSVLEVAVAAVLADLIAHQRLSGLGWLGIALVLVSVLLQTR